LDESPQRRAVAPHRKASRRTVPIALAANLVVTLTKLVGGLISGSGAMLAETAHSLADTVNQGFLLCAPDYQARQTLVVVRSPPDSASHHAEQHQYQAYHH